MTSAIVQMRGEQTWQFKKQKGAEIVLSPNLSAWFLFAESKGRRYMGTLG